MKLTSVQKKRIQFEGGKKRKKKPNPRVCLEIPLYIIYVKRCHKPCYDALQLRVLCFG